MIKTARQLKDLIRNLSREKSADAQLLMRNYMMERFLERISLSEYRDKFILKGGMLVAAMVGLDARSTMDLDATVKGANVNVEDIENLISAIVCSGLKKFYGSIWRCFYDKNSKAAKRFNSQSFQRKICGCTAFNAKLYDGAFSGENFPF